MNKMKKEEVIKNYLGEVKTDELLRLAIVVSKTNTKIDDEIYNSMLKILNNYCIQEHNNLYSFFAFKNIIKNYFDICYRFIINENKNETIVYDIYKIIEKYTEEDLNYKLFISNEFNKLGIIEERSRYDLAYHDMYKKILQILSVKYKNGYLKNSEELYEKSNAKIIHDKAKKIILKLVELNKHSKIVNQTDILKPTNCILEISIYLPDLIVDNEESFKLLIEYLYKMFWDSNLRDNKIIFINNLRNYYYHDIDHGDNSKIKKKYKNIKEFYNKVINKNYPSNSKDWQKLQIYIYDQLLFFLEEFKIIETK